MYAKGVSGNPNGRPKGAKDKFSIVALCEQLKKWEKKTGRNFYYELIKQSMFVPAIATVLLNKLLPNASPIEELDETLAGELQLVSSEQENTIKTRLGKYLSTNGSNGGGNGGTN